MAKMNSFYEDLKDGKETENNVLAIIKKKYPKSYIIEGYFKDYDIYVPEKYMGIEVKKDVKSQETGNLVIEVEFNGKPSALSTTKADYWVFYDGDNYIWITPTMLKDLTENCGHVVEFIGNGGGQFSTNQIKVNVKEGDFYVFPYDLKHGVYPFNSDVKRRTLSANLDIFR